MKTKQMTMAVALGLLPCLLMAGDATTNAVLTTVAGALRPVLERLDPKPTVEYPEHYPASILVTFLPQTYKIHPKSRNGEVWTDAVDKVGPSFRGFVLRVHLQPRGEGNQAITPQTTREPYWQTYLDVTPIGGTDKQAYWTLSYMGRTPTNVLAEIRSAMKKLETGPNNTSDGIRQPAYGSPKPSL